MGFDDLMIQRADLERGTKSTSASGDEIVAWALAQSGIACYVRPARVPADLRPGENETVSHLIYCRPIRALLDAPRADWRMIVGGHEYVLLDPEDAAARGHHLEIRARRLS